MVETVNETLASEAIRRHLELQHYSNAEVRKIIALLNKSDARLSAALQAALERGAPTATVERIEALLHEVRAINRAAYHEVAATFTSNISEYAAHEASAQYSLLQFAIPGQVLARVSLTGISGQQVRAAALARPFQGRLLSEWMTDMAADRAKRIRDAVRMGFVEGKTTPEIVREIRGSRAANYADGLLERPRKDLETVVRTAISHTAAVARDMTAQANSDLIKAIAWNSTLDTRTTVICITRDGKQYTLDHEPIDHNLPWLGGPGQAHWNCRSTSVFVTKSWKELGIDLEDAPEGVRSSMDGYVPASLTYENWLKQQPMSRVVEILGPTRAKLYRDGKLDLTKFVNDKGQLLTLAQLRERDAAAFAKAGISG